MAKCYSCGNANHPERVEMGIHNCIKCSTTPKYGAVPNWGHKTGSSVTIVRDVATANRINKAFDRRNYGIVKGLRGKTGN